jgi:hypothetical protein
MDEIKVSKLIERVIKIAKLNNFSSKVADAIKMLKDEIE